MQRQDSEAEPSRQWSVSTREERGSQGRRGKLGSVEIQGRLALKEVWLVGSLGKHDTLFPAEIWSLPLPTGLVM